MSLGEDKEDDVCIGDEDDDARSGVDEEVEEK